MNSRDVKETEEMYWHLLPLGLCPATPSDPLHCGRHISVYGRDGVKVRHDSVTDTPPHIGIKVWCWWSFRWPPGVSTSPFVSWTSSPPVYWLSSDHRVFRQKFRYCPWEFPLSFLLTVTLNIRIGGRGTPERLLFPEQKERETPTVPRPVSTSDIESH